MPKRKLLSPARGTLSATEGADTASMSALLWRAPIDEPESQSVDRRCEAGDRRAVLDALFVHLRSYPQEPVPKEVRKAFLKAYHKVYTAHAGSWDDVFGQPYPNRQLASVRWDNLMGYQVWHRCRSLYAADTEKNFDDGLFEAVGEEFGIGKTKTKELFSKIENGGGYKSTLWGPPRKRRRRSSPARPR